MEKKVIGLYKSDKQLITIKHMK